MQETKLASAGFFLVFFAALKYQEKKKPTVFVRRTLMDIYNPV
jgi:hypothetical protein